MLFDHLFETSGSSYSTIHDYSINRNLMSKTDLYHYAIM